MAILWIIGWALSGLLPTIWTLYQSHAQLDRQYPGFLAEKWDPVEWALIVACTMFGPVGGVASLIPGIGWWWEGFKDRKKKPSSSPSPSPSSFPTPDQWKYQSSLSPSSLSPSINTGSTGTWSSLWQLGTGTNAQHGPVSPPYVLGFRVWNYEVREGLKHWDVNGKTIQDIEQIQLKGHVFNSHEWHPGVNVALCGTPTAPLHSHTAPAERCSCGFWCLHNLGSAIDRLGAPPACQILGAIVGMGKCIRHTDGWRVEKAVVVAFMAQKPLTQRLITAGMVTATVTIAQLREHQEHARLLSERWDVPLVSANEIEEFARRTASSMYGLNEEYQK